MPGKMVINLNHMSNQATAAFLLISAMLHEMMKKTKFVHSFLHDRHAGAMHTVPTPQKGGRWLNHLCTEFCRFITRLGHSTISLKCEQEPATLSVLEAVRKTCRALGIKTHVETVAPGSHASNGGAEVTVKVLRQNANVLIQQLERGCGISDVIGCHHPLYQWSLLHSAWVHNRFVVRQGLTPYEICSGRSYNGRLALFGECAWLSEGVYKRRPSMDERCLAWQDLLK
jgi:hypothetical protein